MVGIKKYMILMAIILLFSLSSFAALDLKWIGGLTINPCSPGNGQEVTFTATFRTWGGSVTNLKIIGGVDDTTIYNFVHPSIPQGNNVSIQFHWTATPGNHTAWFKLDPKHNTADTDFSNNNLSQQFTVSAAAPKPNLAVIGCDYEPHIYKNGDSVLFKFTVTNNGNGQSPVPSYLDIKEGSNLLKRITLPAMGPGWTNSYTFSYTVKVLSTVSITADSTTLISEGNETDNTCKKFFMIKIPLKVKTVHTQ